MEIVVLVGVGVAVGVAISSRSPSRVGQHTQTQSLIKYLLLFEATLTHVADISSVWCSKFLTFMLVSSVNDVVHP